MQFTHDIYHTNFISPIINCGNIRCLLKHRKHESEKMTTDKCGPNIQGGTK